MAVIKDVATKARVSIGTVSKFFNHPERLRPETYDRVAKAVLELDYQPNPLARSMRTGKTQSIAILVPEITNPFYAEGFSCLCERMNLGDFMPLLITTNNNPIVDDERRLSTLCSRVDAIVLYLLDNKLNAQLLPTLQNEKPTLVITQRHEPQADHCIVIREDVGMESIAQHVLDTGRSRIAFVGGPDHDLMTDTKYSGFLRAMEHRGASSHSALRCAGFSPHLGYLAAKSLFDDTKSAPDAICCANDALAMGCLKYLQANGISVPDEVSVSGYDNLELSLITEPELTTVRLPTAEIADLALDFLNATPEERLASFDSIYLDTTLEVRRSTLPSTDAGIFK